MSAEPIRQSRLTKALPRRFLPEVRCYSLCEVKASRMQCQEGIRGDPLSNIQLAPRSSFTVQHSDMSLSSQHFEVEHFHNWAKQPLTRRRQRQSKAAQAVQSRRLFVPILEKTEEKGHIIAGQSLDEQRFQTRRREGSKRGAYCSN